VSDTTRVFRSAELLERHQYISELAELNRIAENWSTLDREAHVIEFPIRRATGEPVVLCQQAGSIVTVIARADDTDLVALREAAHDLDKDRILSAYARLGNRVVAAADRATSIDLGTVHGIVDVVYGDRIIIRNAVVDAETGFNIFQLSFDGGDVDVTAFRVVEHQVRDGAEPLTALLLVKPRELSPIEREAERLSPPRATGDTITPAPRASFIDAVANVAENVGHGAVKAAEVYGCAVRFNIAQQQQAAGVEAQQGVEHVDQRVGGEVAAEMTAEEVAEVGLVGMRSVIAMAGSGTTIAPGASVDDLLAYRASLLSR
jgi:hypothetical protein